MDILKGKTLKKRDGSSSATETALKDKKLVLFYFSAHWCPPCRGFTPKLKDFYAETAKDGLEIVFVSSDSTVDHMIDYMKESHGDWWAVEHGSDESQALADRFGVSGIPMLVVVKTSDDSLVSDKGREEVTNEGPKVVAKWLQG